MATASYITVDFDTKQIIYIDDTLDATDSIDGLLASIDGFVWDDNFWINQENINPDAIIPALWDPSTKKIDSSQWQSGVGGENDLKIRRLQTSKIDNRTDWKPVVFHGKYYELNEPFYLFSDSSRIRYIGAWEPEPVLAADYGDPGFARSFHKIGFTFDSDDLPLAATFFTTYTLDLDSTGITLAGKHVNYKFDPSTEYECVLFVYPEEIQVIINGFMVLAVVDTSGTTGAFTFPVLSTNNVVQEFSAPDSVTEITLAAIPKQGIPITAYKFKREQSDESIILLENDVKKKVSFSGIVQNGEFLETEDENGNLIESHINTLKDEFLVRYDEDPVRVIFNKDYIDRIGTLTIPTQTAPLGPDNHPIKINEFVGYGALDKTTAGYRLNTFPILRDDRESLEVWIFNPNTLALETDWEEVTDVSLHDSGDKVFQIDRDLGIIRFGHKANDTEINNNGNLLPIGSTFVPAKTTEGFPNSGTIHLVDSFGNDEFFEYGIKTAEGFIGTVGTTMAWASDTRIYDLENLPDTIHGAIPLDVEEIYISYLSTLKFEYEEVDSSDDIIPLNLPLNPIENPNTRAIIHLSRQLIAVDELILVSDKDTVAIGSDFATLTVTANSFVSGETIPTPNALVTLHVEELDTDLGTIAGVGLDLNLVTNGQGKVHSTFLPPSNPDNLAFYFEDDQMTIGGGETEFLLPLGFDDSPVDLSTVVEDDLYLYQILKDDPLSGRAHKGVRIEIDEVIDFVSVGGNLYEYIVKKGFHTETDGTLIIGDIVTDEDINNPGLGANGPLNPNGLTPELKNFSTTVPTITRTTAAPSANGEYKFFMSDYPNTDGRLDLVGDPVDDDEEGTNSVGKIQMYHDSINLAAESFKINYYYYDFQNDDIKFFISNDDNDGNGRKVVLHEVFTDAGTEHPILVDGSGDPVTADIVPVNMPVRPSEILLDKVVYDIEFPVPNSSETTDDPSDGDILGGYWLITDRTVSLYASAINEITGDVIESNRVQIKITLPQYLLGNYIVDPDDIPFGFKFVGGEPAPGEPQIPVLLLQSSSGLDGATYISINPVAGPYPLTLNGITLAPVGTETETFNNIGYQINIDI